MISRYDSLIQELRELLDEAANVQARRHVEPTVQDLANQAHHLSGRAKRLKIGSAHKFALQAQSRVAVAATRHGLTTLAKQSGEAAIRLAKTKTAPDTKSNSHMLAPIGQLARNS